MPAKSPMVTRPAGPIQLLSKANLRKYEMPISNAVMPMRFSQWEPMRDSRSMCGCEARIVDARGGGGGVFGGSAAAICAAGWGMAVVPTLSGGAVGCVSGED